METDDFGGTPTALVAWQLEAGKWQRKAECLETEPGLDTAAEKITYKGCVERRLECRVRPAARDYPQVGRARDTFFEHTYQAESSLRGPEIRQREKESGGGQAQARRRSSCISVIRAGRACTASGCVRGCVPPTQALEEAQEALAASVVKSTEPRSTFPLHKTRCRKQSRIRENAKRLSRS